MLHVEAALPCRGVKSLVVPATLKPSLHMQRRVVDEGQAMKVQHPSSISPWSTHHDPLGAVRRYSLGSAYDSIFIATEISPRIIFWSRSCGYPMATLLFKGRNASAFGFDRRKPQLHIQSRIESRDDEFGLHQNPKMRELHHMGYIYVLPSYRFNAPNRS